MPDANPACYKGPVVMADCRHLDWHKAIFDSTRLPDATFKPDISSANVEINMKSEMSPVACACTPAPLA